MYVLLLWFFASFRNFFSDNTRLKIFFFVARSAKLFVQNLTLGYMTKTLNQIIVFFLHQNQIIFFSNIGNQNIFFRKKTYLCYHLTVKISIRKSTITVYDLVTSRFVSSMHIKSLKCDNSYNVLRSVYSL